MQSKAFPQDSSEERRPKFFSFPVHLCLGTGRESAHRLTEPPLCARRPARRNPRLYAAAPRRPSHSAARRRSWTAPTQTRGPAAELRAERTLGHWSRSSSGRPPRRGRSTPPALPRARPQQEPPQEPGRLLINLVRNDAVGPQGSLSLMHAPPQPVHHRPAWDCNA